jgi:hypothetical protein
MAIQTRHVGVTYTMTVVDTTNYETVRQAWFSSGVTEAEVWAAGDDMAANLESQVPSLDFEVRVYEVQDDVQLTHP